MLELSNKIRYDGLTYHFKDRGIPKKRFNEFDNAISLFKKTKDGKRTLEKVKQSPNEFKSSLNETKKTKT